MYLVLKLCYLMKDSAASNNPHLKQSKHEKIPLHIHHEIREYGEKN